ncbi:unnamed protein product, partial [marine sediment metagenome]
DSRHLTILHNHPIWQGWGKKENLIPEKQREG